MFDRWNRTPEMAAKAEEGKVKGRSVIGIILTVLGVVAVVLAFFPKAFVPEPKPGFGPYQIVAIVVGLLLMLLGYRSCCCKSSCGCGTCETKPPQETPQ